MYVCMYVCTYVCMYVCMYVRMYVHTVRMYVQCVTMMLTFHFYEMIVKRNNRFLSAIRRMVRAFSRTMGKKLNEICAII